MWTKSGIESEGQYAFSCELLRTLRFIYEIQPSESHPWRKTIDGILKSFLMDFQSISRPKEAEILFGLLRGCDYLGLAPYQNAITSNKDKIQIIGFVNKGWTNRNSNSGDQYKVHDDFNNRDLKVLGVLYSDKHRERSEFQLYEPNDLKLVSETAAPTHATSGMFKHQFKINAEILNRLLEDSDLLQSVDEESASRQSLDIYQLNTRTLIMKLINHQLQSNSENFLHELKASNFYQSLLKFVCRESSVEMKGDIMLLEWLEYKCFAIRKYACENQQSLAKQREVFTTLVKDKLYISWEGPKIHPGAQSGNKQMTAIKLNSAINYKNFEEKKEVKLVHSNDVFLSQDSSKAAQKQVVLIDPETLMQRGNGLDILNSCEGAITFKADLKQLIKSIFIKQREDRDKYLLLAQKTVFLVSEEEYKRLHAIVNNQSSNVIAPPPNTTKSHQNTKLNKEEDDNFDNVFEDELIRYGGFHRSIAKKTSFKDSNKQDAGLTIEQRTEKLVKLCKQVKEGSIAIDDEEDDMENVVDSRMGSDQNREMIRNMLSEIHDSEESTKKHPEERSENLIYLKNSFQHHLEKQFSDKGNSSNSSTKDALYDVVNNINKQDLASEYEKSLIRLFNMYCRHVFWSLIQRESEIESIFSMILETKQDMRAFATFLKVLGNECFITGNKVYIKAYKTFLKKVIIACSGEQNKFRPFLDILLKESLIQAYENNLLSDLHNEQKQYTERRIEEFFKTESKASQLMNPFLIVPLLRLILANDPSIFEPYADRLINILLSVNCLFVGNFSLKDHIFELIVSLLEQLRQKQDSIPPQVIKNLLTSKLISTLFSPRDFEEQRHYEREEVEYAKRILKDNSGSKEIEGIPRANTEKLVYARRAQVMQYYFKVHNKESVQVLIEILYKMYQLDKNQAESVFKYKNNLMTHMEVYSKIIEQGKDGKLNEHLLFINHKLPSDDKHESKILTTTFETNHKEYKGVFSAHIKFSDAKKLLLKLNSTSEFRQGAAMLITSDKEGTNVLALFNEYQVKKEIAFENVYADNVWVHYPVYPSYLYQIAINDGENATPSLIDQPLYKPIERFEEHSIGKFFVTKGSNKMYIWKNEELRRYKDHLDDIQQITFGKQCRIILMKNGKVWAEGRNKGKHIIDQENEVAEVKGVEIPFFDKKDKLIRLSSFFQVTIGVTEKGKIYAVGDKIAKSCKIENTKFGFFEIPLGEIYPEKPKQVIEEENPKQQVQEDKAEKQELKTVSEPAPEQPSAEAKQEDQVDQKLAEEKSKDQQLIQPLEEAGSKPEQPQFSIEEKQPEISQEIQCEILQSQGALVELNQVQQQEEPQPSIEQQQQNHEEDVPPISNSSQDQQKDVEVSQSQVQVEQEAQLFPQQEVIVNNNQNDEIASPKSNEQANQNDIKPDSEIYNAADNQDQQQKEEEHKNPGEKEEEHKGEEAPSAGDSKVEVEQIDTSAPKQEVKEEEPQKPLEGTLFAHNAWACKSSNTGDFVYLALVHNSYLGRTELRSVGHSQFGNLGQGKDIIDSTVFKPIDLPVEIRSPEDVFIGYDYTFVIGKDENVYAWGSYTSEDKFQFSPVRIKYFEKYIVHKITGYQRTCALVTPKDNPSKKLLVFGKCAPFVSEDQMKVIDLSKYFQCVDIYNIQSVGEKILISTEGKYKYRANLSKQKFTLERKVHDQKCDVCEKNPLGLMHFYKDSEEKLHFYCIDCIKNIPQEVEYQWVIRRPIQDIEKKVFPKIDTQAFLSDQQSQNPIYYTRVMINDKEVEQKFSLQDLIEESSVDFNPIIFLRFTNQFKEGQKPEVIKLEDFYEKTSKAGLSLNVTPDYTLSEHCQEIITKNQALYDDFRKCFTDVEALDEPLRKEFKHKIEDFITKQMKDVSSLHEIKLKDLKITEETLKFTSDKLNELSEECKRMHLGKYLQFLQYLWGAYTYIYRGLSSCGPSKDFSLLSVYNSHKHKVPLALKNKILRRLTDNIGSDDSTVSIHVNRKKAREFFESGKIDEKGEYTVFAQVQKGLASRNYQGMRINSSDKKAWFVKFIGEFALDQGGLFRESLTELCQELQSPVLNLLIPTQNQKNLMGESRDKWTLNPAANSPAQFKMLEFLGTLIGMSVRSGILMSLQLPAFFWKQLTDEELTVEDLKEIDSMTVNILNDLKSMSEEKFSAYEELNFTTILSNGEEIELVHGGKHKKVTSLNLKEFIDRTLNARFRECKKQIKAIKKGIDITFDSKFLRLLSWKDLQYKVVGKDIIDIDRLKEITAYRNCNESHEVVKKLWKILNVMSNEEKSLYLKFVWGRTRLPLKEEDVSENHTIQLDEHADLAKLPIGRTCFFRLEIPAYKSEDSFRDKLLYAIRHCTAIDADIEGAVHNEEEMSDHQNNTNNDRESERRRDRSSSRRSSRRDEEDQNHNEDDDGDNNNGNEDEQYEDQDNDEDNLGGDDEEEEEQ